MIPRLYGRFRGEPDKFPVSACDGGKAERNRYEESDTDEEEADTVDHE